MLPEPQCIVVHGQEASPQRFLMVGSEKRMPTWKQTKIVHYVCPALHKPVTLRTRARSCPEGDAHAMVESCSAASACGVSRQVSSDRRESSWSECEFVKSRGR